MQRPADRLVIDARPRGPDGPLAAATVLGRPVLAHLLDLAGPADVSVHARPAEHASMRSLLGAGDASRVQFVTGPPPEDAAILRADRLYDAAKLSRILRRGRDPEGAVLWRLDGPDALAHAEAELSRRRTYQPLGRYWALAPARTLARILVPTRVRPNALTLAAGGSMLAASALVGFGSLSLLVRLATAALLALALVLDTADGHLARLQGTATPFGRWLDALLDEAADMALHAAIAWSAYARDGRPGWLAVGMLYAIGKYIFTYVNAPVEPPVPPSPGLPAPAGRATSFIRLLGHADLRWHAWIALAALGRLDAALLAYAAYYPARALAGIRRKAAARA